LIDAIDEAVQQAIADERARCMRIVEVRIAACDKQRELNDEKQRDWNYDCQVDMSNALRSTLAAIGDSTGEEES
jgi:hypothetical protein